MKFWLFLLCIVGVLFFAFRSCSAKLNPDETPPPETVESSSSAVAPPGRSAASLVKDSLMLDSAVVRSYRFKRRPLPAGEVLERLVDSSGDGAVRILADAESNAVILRGAPLVVAGLVSAFEALDVEADEAFLESWFVFVRGDSVAGFEAGLEYREGGMPFGSVSVDNTSLGVVLPIGAVAVRLNWASEIGALEVVEKPYVRLSSGVESTVSTGEEVAFPVTTFDNGIATTSVDFRRVGLTFTAKPLFLEADRVRLDLVAENGLVGPPQKVGDIEIPKISNQRVTGSATLGYGEALVFGGLETLRKSQRFGWLGKKEDVTAGRLYVVLMLRSGYPKASPVYGLSPGFPLAPPGSPAVGLPGFDSRPSPFDGLLPSKDWEREESDFLKGRSHPAGK